jgi:hypothetical protein
MSELADHISGPNAQFLRKQFLVSKVFELMDPYLVFTGMFPAIPVDSRAVITTKDNYSNSTDPMKVWPARLTESSDWPNVSITPMTQDSAMLQKYGLQLKIGEDLLKNTADRTVIMKDVQRVAFWLAQFFNNNLGTTLIADGTSLAGNWAPTSVWSDTANATPIQDLVTFKRSMRRTDKPFACTDIYVNTADYNDLELFLIDVNADLAKRQLIGTTTVGEDSVYIPALRGTVHRIDDGIDEGRILGLDRINPCGTYYYYNDPRYGSQSISYSVVSEGKKVQKSVPGFGLNTHQYFDDKSHEIITQFWFDGVFVVEEPYGAITDTGI